MKKKAIINDAILYIFEEHRLCPLRVRGKESILNVPASRCLQLLLERPGIVISQSEFFNEVWQKNGQYVTANTLYQNISLLRKGMREAGLTKNVIRTIPKVGVVFSGTVEILEEGDSEGLEQKIATPEAPSLKISQSRDQQKNHG
ncbi:winged helix-turn-helix domain-containing protein [Serratia sp. L9]|uniref:winged helix-turn-helix domain-containing protein n=1 Tax=Serratia sp. L9 TaxID=3423946 RepID=UPI003D666DF0